jgi:hypothetical protein
MCFWFGLEILGLVYKKHFYKYFNGYCLIWPFILHWLLSHISVENLSKKLSAKGSKRSARWKNHVLKVLINENRGGLKVASFDRSPFKLFTLRFSNKSVQAPSCERPKTAPRTLFLLFANKNCIPIPAWCRAATQFLHQTLICNNGIVHPPRYLRRR